MTFCMLLGIMSSLVVGIYATETSEGTETISRYTVSGMSAVVSKNIMIGETDTGAIHTQIALPSKSTYNPYSSDAVINVVEVAPGGNASFAALNTGSYNWSQTTMGAAALKYNETHDSTVIAAVNGDPWLVHHTDYDGDGAKATGDGVKHGSVGRSMLIVDGEIYNTPQTAAENYLAAKDGGSGAEYGGAASNTTLFAVKNDGTFMIGDPTVSITLKRGATNLSAPTGINRLPAPDSLMIYNHRVGSESMAYKDAYEVYLTTEDSAFAIGKTVQGTVTAIFESESDEERPVIDEKTIVLSARGSKMSTMKGFKVVGGLSST